MVAISRWKRKLPVPRHSLNCSNIWVHLFGKCRRVVLSFADEHFKCERLLCRKTTVLLVDIAPLSPSTSMSFFQKADPSQRLSLRRRSWSTRPRPTSSKTNHPLPA
jgi:hypothetical protein